MTESVFSKILESLSLDDTATAESALAEWFNEVQDNETSASEGYALEARPDGEAIWSFESLNDAEIFVRLATEYYDALPNAGVEMKLISPSEIRNYVSDDKVFNYAPSGCMSDETAETIGRWTINYGSEDSDGYAIYLEPKVQENLTENTDPYALATYVTEYSGSGDAIWAFESGDDAERFVQLNIDQYPESTQMMVSNPDEAAKNAEDGIADLLDLAPAGCMNDVEEVGIWMQDHGTDASEGQCYATLKDSLKNGNMVGEVTEPAFTPVAEAENTVRCGECGEVDASMDPDQEFCDQCIAEANARMESANLELAALVEEFKGLIVTDKLANKEGAQVGNADKVEVNTKSPTPNIKASKRVAGNPVEIKAEEHKGFDKESSPVVKDVKVKNPAPKAERGEFSDKLNNQEGAQVGNADKVEVNTVSPIGSKARD